MSLGKKLFIGGSGGTCSTDSADVFGDSSGVALYTLDYDASDASGNYNGSTNSNVTFGVKGKINTAADFTGGGVATIPNNVIFGNNHSVSVWFKLDNTSGYQGIFDFDYNNRIIFRVASSDANEANIGTSGWFAHNINFSANLWYHLVVTFSNGNPFKIYVNGNIAYTGGNSSLNAQLGDNNFGAGNAAGTHSINGKIDQLRIFNKELSATEVSTLYAETACVYTSTTDIVNYQGTNTAYYKLDNTAEDETGNYDGTESNITYEFGRYGAAAVFNGSSSKIDLPNLGTGVSGSSARSVSAWIKLDDTPSGFETVYASGSSSNGSAFAFFVTSSKKIRLYYYNRQYDSSTVLNVGQWYHIVVTYNGGNIQGSVNSNIYINGNVETISDAGGTATGVASTTNSNYSIGYERASTNYYFDGTIDQVRIYNSALDATAVANLYNEKPEAQPNFNVATYTGTGNTQYISNVGIDLEAHGGLIWFKERNGTNFHQLYDNVRGYDNAIYSNDNGAEYNYSTHPNGDLAPASVEANGFFTPTVTNNGINRSGGTYVSWVWKGGGDAVSNTVGTITSQVSANQDAGFSIVKWTGNDTANATIGHGLASSPEMYIIKKTSAAADWQVNLASSVTGTEGYANLNATAALYTTFPNYYTSANSTILSTNGTTTAERLYNNQSADYVAYCFHSVTGYQKIGSFTYSAGVSVNVGFEPQFVMFKKTSAAGGWTIVDNKRSSGGTDYGLFANLSSAEVTNTDYLNLTSTGFTTTYSDTGTFIYLAIA